MTAPSDLPDSAAPENLPRAVAHSADSPGARRISSTVALRVFEVIRRLDQPTEVLEDENPSLTMPRRLGLSEVVERQIDRYAAAVRRGQKLSDAELFELVQLVIRRPDATKVFFHAGSSLVAGQRSLVQFGARVLPESAEFFFARRRVQRGLRKLFGRRVGGFSAGPFALEGRSLLFYQADPQGHACAFVTGYAQGVFDGITSHGRRVIHSQCEARGDDRCRWTVQAEIHRPALDSASVGDFLRLPEPEAG